MKMIIALSTLISLFQAHSLAAPRCEVLVADTKPTATATEDASLKSLVKDKSASKTIRSSAGHFWGVIDKLIDGDISSKLSGKQKDVLKKLFKVEGWVMGDLHNGNVGPVRVGVTAENLLGKVDYGVLDFDDAAKKGSLVGDFAHEVIASKAVEIPLDARISKQEMFDAYLKGLKGKDYPTPARISKLLDISPEEFRQLEIKKAKKFTAKDGKSLIKDGVRSDKVTEAERLEVERVAENAIGEFYDVLDVGGREKDSGGSAGALRYMLLVKEKSTEELFLFDLKEDAISAVSEQKDQPKYTYEDRLNHFVHKNNEKDIRYHGDLLVNHEGKQVKMTLRPRPLYFFDYANDGSQNSAFKEFRDLTLFNSYWVGFKQRRDDFENASDLMKAIREEGAEDVFDSIKALTRELNRFYEDQSRDFRETKAQEKKEKKQKEKKKDK